jgi:hypothetical protein
MRTLVSLLASTALAFVALLQASPASAQLYALNYDRSTGSTTLATVNAVDGSLSDVGSGAPVCCEVAMSANAFDPFAQKLLAFGPSAADPSISVLYRFDLATGAGALVGSVSLPGRIVGAVFEQSTQRLLALRQLSATQLDLLAVDTATAAAVVVNPGIADCCDLIPGAVAERSGVFYVLGRVRSGADPQTLIGFSTSSAAVTQLPVATPLAALVKDRASNTLYGLQQLRSAAPVNHSLQLVSVDVVSAILTPVGTATADCCAIAPDTVAINDGALRAVGTRVGGSGFDLISMDLVTGTASFSSAPLASNRIIDGLFDGLKGLLPSTTSIVSISPSPAVVGQPYTVSVSVSSMSGTPTGNVIVNDGNGAQCTVVLPASSCQLTSVVVAALTITADYGGDVGFAGSSDSAPLLVERAPSSTVITSIVPSPSTIGQAYTVSVSVTGFGMPSGDVAVDDGAGAMCTITLPANSCMLTSTVVGSKTISASYPGDGLNLPSTTTAPHDVLRAASATTITGIVPATSSIVGQPYTVSVSVTGFGVPVGNVVIGDGAGASCTVVLPAVSCSLTSTSAGARTITASYGGDVNNLPSSDTEPYAIDRSPSTTTIDSVVPSPGVVGQPYAVTVSVSGYGTPIGTIAVDDGTGASCSITLPVTSCNLTSSTAGAKTLTASYSGDVNNLPSSATAAQTVNPAPTTTALTAVPDPAIVGQTVVLTATVSGGVNSTGTVAFLDGANPIGGCAAVTLSAGSASCSTSFSPQGTRNLVANYSGDANNLASSGALSLSVDRVPTTTTLTASPLAVVVGDPVQLSITVSGGVPPLSGTVSITANGVALPVCQNLVLDGNGQTSCVVTFADFNVYQLVATYTGDIDDQPSSGSASVTVTAIKVPALGGPGLLLLGLLMAGLVLLPGVRRQL